MLACDRQSTYDRRADGLTPGCVVSASRCSAGSPGTPWQNLRFSDLPSQPAQRAADPEGGPSPSGVRSPAILFRGGLERRHHRLSPLSHSGIGESRRSLRRTPAIKAAPLPPRCSDGPTLDAPDCDADEDTCGTCADAKPKLRASPCTGFPIGTAPRVAFRPSFHPRIRWTVASPGCAICACRHARPPPP